jgi:bacteriochlorophyllide a dehydrogenase
MHATAVILQKPECLVVGTLGLTAPTAEDVVVDIDWSGISTGTERLLWSGRMPPFPGLGYPLVPGYESVGRVQEAGAASGRRVGDVVFVPGSNCFGEVRGLFGGAASRVVVPGARVLPIDAGIGDRGVLLALAATAHHAIAARGSAELPQLIVGHGVLGRLLARLTIALGGPEPTVWEQTIERRGGAAGYGYRVLDEVSDARRDYRSIYDASGDAGLLDTLIARLAKGGEVVLAGFYEQRPSFAFPPAFMREARLRVAAEWAPADLAAVRDLAENGRLSLDDLITHRVDARAATAAYRTAFDDPSCLKMVLDWKGCA